MKLPIDIISSHFAVLVDCESPYREGFKIGVITKETLLSLIHSGGASFSLTSMGLMLIWINGARIRAMYLHPCHSDRFGDRSVLMEFSIDLDCYPAYCVRHDIVPVPNVDNEVFQAYFPDDESGCLSYSDIW